MAPVEWHKRNRHETDITPERGSTRSNSNNNDEQQWDYLTKYVNNFYCIYFNPSHWFIYMIIVDWFVVVQMLE